MSSTAGGGWRNPDYGFDPQGFASGLGGLFGGLFGNSSKPYDKAQEQYDKYYQQAQGYQQPYNEAGIGAIGNYQDWLNKQKDPTAFINDIMGQYQESPYAQYQQKQAMRAGTNAASASGLTGSTPFAQQLQQNAGAISSKDQNDWLQNVLGINTQYGQGQNNLMNSGQNSANQLSNLGWNMGQSSGENQYNKYGNKQNNFWNTLGGLGQIGLSFL